MWKRIAQKWKQERIGGLFRTVRYRFFPSLVPSYPQLLERMEGKRGLEIGGPSRFFQKGRNFPVYPVAGVIDNCNFGPVTLWEGALKEGAPFLFHPDRPPGKQFLLEATDLHSIADESYDFLLSSHCIEHIANPMKALTEWKRVLKQGGVMVVVVPHRGATFDHRRPVTPLEHLLDDDRNGTGEDDLTHLEEILELHDLERDRGVGSKEEFRARSLRNNEFRALHHHVFDLELAEGMVRAAGFTVLETERIDFAHIVVSAEKECSSRDGDV